MKAIRRRVIGAKNLNTLADSFKSATYNQLKLLRYESLQFVHEGEIDDQDQSNEMINQLEKYLQVQGHPQINSILDMNLNTMKNGDHNQAQGHNHKDNQFHGSCTHCGQYGHTAAHCFVISC